MPGPDSRFGVALHALTLMAYADAPVPSQRIAMSVGTNASWIRESAGALRAAGIIRSVRGPGGGLTLAADPGDITLAQIWLAVEGPALQPARLATQPDNRCAIGGHIEPHLCALSARMVEAVRADLAQTTLAEWAAGVAPDGRESPPGGPAAST
ncbi:MAG: Rrf2 family transcriptional regulator [Nocardioides sp.]